MNHRIDHLLLLLVLFFFECIELHQSQVDQFVDVQYLGQYNRSNDTEENAGYMVDAYFRCTVNGTFVHWKYLDIPLSGFHTGQVGVTHMGAVESFNYTATLISSERLSHDTSSETLNSMLILTFEGQAPTTFPVTCTSNLNYAVPIDTNRNTYDIKSSNGTIKDILLKYVLLYNVNVRDISIFLCEASYEQQLVNASGLLIGFSRYDSVGVSRTVFSTDRSIATVHGILLSRTRSGTTSLIIVPHTNSNIQVTCFYNTHRALILTGVQSPTTPLSSSTESFTSDYTGSNPTASPELISGTVKQSYYNATEGIMQPMESTTFFWVQATTGGVSNFTVVVAPIVVVLILLLMIVLYTLLVRCTKRRTGMYKLPQEKDVENCSEQSESSNLSVEQDQQNHDPYVKKNIAFGFSINFFLPVKSKWKVQDVLRVVYESLKKNLTAGSLQDVLKVYFTVSTAEQGIQATPQNETQSHERLLPQASGENNERLSAKVQDYSARQELLNLLPEIPHEEENRLLAEVQDDGANFAQYVHGKFSHPVIVSQGALTYNVGPQSDSRVTGMDYRKRKVIS